MPEASQPSENREERHDPHPRHALDPRGQRPHSIPAWGIAAGIRPLTLSLRKPEPHLHDLAPTQWLGPPGAFAMRLPAPGGHD